VDGAIGILFDKDGDDALVFAQGAQLLGAAGVGKVRASGE
jgi:hypothetical protein